MELQLNSTWVKAPDIQPQVVSGTRMEAVNDASFQNLQGRIVVDNSYTKNAILTPKVEMTIGCWNVRTLYSAGATQLLIQELNRFMWDLVGLSETHWTGAGA